MKVCAIPSSGEVEGEIMKGKRRVRGEIVWASNCVDRTGNENAEIIYLYMHRWTKGTRDDFAVIVGKAIRSGPERIRICSSGPRYTSVSRWEDVWNMFRVQSPNTFFLLFHLLETDIILIKELGVQKVSQLQKWDQDWDTYSILSERQCMCYKNPQANRKGFCVFFNRPDLDLTIPNLKIYQNYPKAFINFPKRVLFIVYFKKE